jgi:Kef-type K+ transport system membrane component KefB
VSMTARSANAQGGASRPLWQVFALLILAGVALWCLGGILRWWARRWPGGELRLEALVVIVVVALLGGAAGEWIGVHAMVGAFAAGLVTPREFRAALIDKLESITLILLLPLFFALTGLRTNLIFSSGTGAYTDLALLLLVATAGKWGGTFLGARAGGMGTREASQLGVLMNARGLVELIVLNAGMDSGILPPAVFSMMVFMALFTTFITSPLLAWQDRR